MLDYREIYLHNNYEVERSPTSTLFFSLEHLSYHNLFSRPFAIITAYNPNNRQVPDAVNLERNRQLYKDLNSYETLKAKGCYEDHCEKGYLVFNISLEIAIGLGKKYHQYAIFYNDTKTANYIECKSEKEIVGKRIDSEESKG